MFNGISDFCVMCKDRVTAKVHLDENNNVTVEKLSMRITEQPFYGGPVDLNRITDFFEGRCYQRNYAGIGDVLKAFGLTEYNAWEMVKINHGYMSKDDLWIKFPGENLTWEDVNVSRPHDR